MFSDPLQSTLLKHLWRQFQPHVFLDTTLQACHTCIWGVLQFFSADPLKFCQVGRGALLHSYFQVSLEIQDRIHAGPLKDIQRLVPKPLLHCLGCVLRVFVLFEGESLPQSQVLWALEQVFIKDLSVLWFVHLCLDPGSSSSPCRWKTYPLWMTKYPH